jgi:multiple sugar transport system permease protein
LAEVVAARRVATVPASRRHLQRTLTAYAFVGPALLVLAAFIVYPAVYSFLLSFHEWNGFTPDWGDFVGLENYVALMRDEIFWKAGVNSILFVAVRTPLEVGIAFGLALVPAHDVLRPGGDVADRRDDSVPAHSGAERRPAQHLPA